MRYRRSSASALKRRTHFMVHHHLTSCLSRYHCNGHNFAGRRARDHTQVGTGHAGRVLHSRTLKRTFLIWSYTRDVRDGPYVNSDVSVSLSHLGWRFQPYVERTKHVDCVVFGNHSRCCSRKKLGVRMSCLDGACHIVAKMQALRSAHHHAIRFSSAQGHGPGYRRYARSDKTRVAVEAVNIDPCHPVRQAQLS